MAKKQGLIERLIVGSDKSEGYARSTLPSNRWELFWDILKGRFWKLVLINLMIVVALLPTLLLILMLTMNKSVYGSLLPYGQTLGSGYPFTPGLDYRGFMYSLQLNFDFFTYLIPALVFAGLLLTGVMYILRNMVWTEGIFLSNDFFKGFKDNWLNFLFIGLMEGVVLWLTNVTQRYVSVINYAGEGNWLITASSVVSYIIAGYFTIMCFHMMSLNVTYKLNLWQLIRNSFILTLGLLPQNIFFIVLCFAPVLIWLLIPSLGAIVILVYLLIGFSGALLGWTTYTQWVFDKFINDKVEGAKINRGIYEKVDAQGNPVQKKVRESKIVRRRPLKPVTDEEVTITELPTTFTRADLQRLAEEKQRMSEEAERWSIEHEGDPDIIGDYEILAEDDESYYEGSQDAMALDGDEEAVQRELDRMAEEDKQKKSKKKKK